MPRALLMSLGRGPSYMSAISLHENEIARQTLVESIPVRFAMASAALASARRRWRMHQLARSICMVAAEISIPVKWMYSSGRQSGLVAGHGQIVAAASQLTMSLAVHCR
jgi:hypothetical protein